ncbi:MAG TPA: hypothetical protein VK157_16855 [Phycisphaerales bacterium]|nr:hypothetical protein [Phycisphaerales bacterium]
MQQSEPTGVSTSHATFGDLVTSRKATWGDRIAAVMLAIFAIPAILSAGALTVVALTGGFQSRPNAPSGTGFVVAFMWLLAAAFVVGAWNFIRRWRTTYEFFATGAVVRRGGETIIEMPYASVSRFRFLIVRQYVNGIYAGTSLDVRLTDDQRRCVRYQGKHKERAKGLGMTIFGKRFEGTDELDIVRILIAEQMLPAMSKRLAEVGSVEWCGKVQLSATGVTPVRGKYKRTEVPYAAIGGVMVKGGAYHAFRKGDERSFLDLAMGDENFWPGLLLFESLVSQYQPEAVQEDGAAAQAT